MRSKIATYALAGALGLTGVVGAALVVPAAASAATGDSTALEERVTSLKNVLKGLVSDGTLTQTQADEVADTLAEARPEGLRGGHGGRLGRLPLDAAADALGLTVDELRTAAEDGSSLADLAKQEGVSTDTLVQQLVAAEKAHLAEAVADGRLTQAEADERAADASTRITERLDDPLRFGRGGHGGGHGGHGPDGDGDADDEPSTAPSATPSEDPNA